MQRKKGLARKTSIGGYGKGSSLKRTPFKKRSPLRASELKKTQKKSKGLPTTAKLKKELDRVFSIYIRLKFPKRCYTCGKVDVTLQCGHFVSRQYLATRWSEDNCRPQCVGCNMFGNGQLLDFEENLKRELGDEFVENMKKSRHQILKLDRQWYESEIAKYKSMI
jgi:hypothetical protein